MDPIGSAGAFDQLLLVEWALPWPSDVSEIEPLADGRRRPRARLMTVVPHAGLRGDDGLAPGRAPPPHRHAPPRRRRPPRARRRDPRRCSPRCSTTPDRPLRDWPTVVGDAPPEVLVCGHGRRDPCCGRWGTLLHVELAARGTGARVWRCSHTGGHRFAPTAITLPDGRAWAYADADLLDGVLARTGDVGALAAHDRGCTAFDPWAQVVERALFDRARLGVARRRGHLGAHRRSPTTGGRPRSSSSGGSADGTAGRRRRRGRRHPDPAGARVRRAARGGQEDEPRARPCDRLERRRG